MERLFPMGAITATPGAMELLDRTGVNPGELLRRHLTGDWGDVDEHDRRANNRAVKESTRIVSAYKDVGGETIWIITEADRSVTTILLPEDY